MLSLRGAVAAQPVSTHRHEGIPVSPHRHPPKDRVLEALRERDERHWRSGREGGTEPWFAQCVHQRPPWCLAPHPAPPTQGPAGAKGQVPTLLLLEPGQAPVSAFHCLPAGSPEQLGVRSEGNQSVSVACWDDPQINASLCPEKLHIHSNTRDRPAVSSHPGEMRGGRHELAGMN